ncbi:MAG: hypothetical protein R2751_01080 [Bacteroidales bacterium]
MKLIHPIVLAGLLLVFALPMAKGQDTVRARTGQPASEVRNGQGTGPTVQHGEKQTFVDLDGDGYNDNAPDHDGDGIPNGLDPDWKRRNRSQRLPFVDLNGDGVNDNLAGTEADPRTMEMRGGTESGHP